MNATITIPKCGPFPESTHDGLSDELAMSFGRRAAKTLSDDDGFVTVRLSTGKHLVIGHADDNGNMVIGRVQFPDAENSLVVPFDMDVIRRCGGFREWANDVVTGPIL